MNHDTKRTIQTAVGIFLTIVAVIVYVGIYRLPVLRYAHQIFPLTSQSDMAREYQKDGCSIRIAESADSAEIRFSDSSGNEWLYTVSQDGYLVTACNARQETLLSGFWQGKRLCNPESKVILPEYEAMLSRLKTETFAPEAADAIYIYKSYPTSMRGKLRAPVIVFLIAIAWMIAAARADSPRMASPQPGQSRAERLLVPHQKYAGPLLKDYGKAEKSPESKAILNTLLLSVFACLALCIAAALYDILCY